jgi:hypothetical protein
MVELCASGEGSLRQEEPLCPRIEAQIHRVLDRMQLVWDGKHGSPEPAFRAPTHEPKGRPVRQKIIAYLTENPEATTREIMHMVECSRDAVRLARNAMKEGT